MSIPFTKKYEPRTESDLVGQTEALSSLKDFITNYKKQKKHAALLYGPPGTGKTSAAYVLAHLFELEILELNASDIRNADQITQRVGSALNQKSLFFKGKIILVDEIDGLSGSNDRGGLQALIKLLEDAYFPVILTCANAYDQKLSSLKSKCLLVEFKELPLTEVLNRLKFICVKENIKFDESALRSLARHCAGDLRASITDLELLSVEKLSVSSSAVEALTDRFRTESMPQALVKVFKTTDPSIALAAFDFVQEDIDQQFLWVDENLPVEYINNKDLSLAYNYLSRADVFRGRIRRQQHWRFLVYVNDLMTAGIATSKSEKYSGFTLYKPTGRILKIWMANQKNALRKSIAQSIAKKNHCSVKEIIKNMHYYKAMFKDKDLSIRLGEEWDLEKAEIAWLSN